MISRTAILAFLASALQTASAQDFFIRAEMNLGLATTHTHCSEHEFEIVKGRVLGELASGDRNLRSGGRKLTVNCQEICCEYDHGCCVHDYPRCSAYPIPGQSCDDDDDDWWRRNLLGGSKNPSASFVVMDDFFFEEGEERRLQDSGVFVTIEECNARKAHLMQNVLASLDDISTIECANMLLAPSNLQCIAVVVE